MANLGRLYKFELKKTLQRKMLWISLVIMLAVALLQPLAQVIGYTTISNDLTGGVPVKWSHYELAQMYRSDPAGLDPKERVRFRELIAQLGKDSIVLLSTHIVSDVEHIADTVLMMKDGQIIYNGAWDRTHADLEAFYLELFGLEADDHG